MPGLNTLREGACKGDVPRRNELFLVFQPQEVRDEVKMLGVRP